MCPTLCYLTCVPVPLVSHPQDKAVPGHEPNLHFPQFTLGPRKSQININI